jgi:hypothetical protein
MMRQAFELKAQLAAKDRQRKRKKFLQRGKKYEEEEVLCMLIQGTGIPYVLYIVYTCIYIIYVYIIYTIHVSILRQGRASAVCMCTGSLHTRTTHPVHALLVPYTHYSSRRTNRSAKSELRLTPSLRKRWVSFDAVVI